MNRYWKDVEGTIPAEIGDLVARVDNNLLAFLLVESVEMLQSHPVRMPVLQEVQRDE